jgi:hypothetical protein
MWDTFSTSLFSGINKLNRFALDIKARCVAELNQSFQVHNGVLYKIKEQIFLALHRRCERFTASLFWVEVRNRTMSKLCGPRSIFIHFSILSPSSHVILNVSQWLFENISYNNWWWQ